MLRILSRIQLVYLGAAVAACLGLIYYQATFVWPAEACEGHGGWWSDRYRECATPIPIWRFTGRMPGQPRTAAGGPAAAAYIERGAVAVSHPQPQAR
jgi:hypothetical protein